MHGNLAELCLNDYFEGKVDPEGGYWETIRGGSYRSKSRFLRSATRSLMEPTTRERYIGFRIALTSHGFHKATS